MEKSNARRLMESAATYLASGNDGRRGLDPKEVEVALFLVRSWKIKFVNYMKSQPTYDSTTGEPMGIGKASEIADNIFRGYYNQEVRAFDEPTISPYFSREAGLVEWGGHMFNEIPNAWMQGIEDFGPEYRASEDPEYQKWSNIPEYMTEPVGDDEVVEKEDGFHEIRDYSREKMEYAELLVQLIHTNNKELVLRRAKSLCDIDVISSYLYWKLRDMAAMLTQKDNKPVQSRRDWVSEQLSLGMEDTD